MAENPYVNKVVYGGTTLVDLTGDTVEADKILSGYTAHDKSGAPITGTIPGVNATTYNTSMADQTIAAGSYLAGTQTIRKVTTANIAAGNIKYGVTVKVGDAGDDDRIKSATGTFSGSSTVSSGQTAAAAGQILSGYSAFVNGAEVKGNIPSKSSSSLTVSGKTVTAPAGYYASAASKSVADGSVTVTGGTVTLKHLPITISSTGQITLDPDAIAEEIDTTASGVEISVTSGYVTSATDSTSPTVALTNAYQLPTQAGKTVTPTESQQTAVAAGKYTTGAVVVAAVPSDYVGSGISQRSSSDLTASGATVTAPAGYYAEAASKAVSSGSAKTPATTVTANPSISVNASGLVTATASAAKSVTPTVTAGYVSSGTAGTVTVSGSNTKQLDSSVVTQGTTTVSGSTATRGTLSLGQGWESGQTVNAATFSNTATSGVAYVDISNTTDAPVLVSGSSLFINKGYVDNLKISLAKLVPDGASASLASNKILSGYSAYDNNGALITGSITSKAAATYTPTTSNQSISSGQYLSGAQTIKGDANLVADKIRSGYSIFGVAGSFAGTTVSYTESDNDSGGKTVTITVTEPAAAS